MTTRNWCCRFQRRRRPRRRKSRRRKPRSESRPWPRQPTTGRDRCSEKELWRRFAAVEPLGEYDAILLEITDRLIERVNLGVVAAHHQLQLFDAAGAQPVFRRIHDGAAMALEALIGVDSDVID